MDSDLPESTTKNSHFAYIRSVLQREIEHLNCTVKYAERKKQKLEKEMEVISGYIKEDQETMAVSEKYLKKYNILKYDPENDEEIRGEFGEMNSKMDTVHWRLCNLTRQVANLYYTKSNESVTEKSNKNCNDIHELESVSDESSETVQADEGNASTSEPPLPPQKSLLDVLKCLLYDLNPNKSDKIYGKLKIDDSVSSDDINFLLENFIVQRSKEDEFCIELRQKWPGNSPQIIDS